MYGNYKGYYKRRQENDRHGFLKEEWFQGKACLDIGCNEGVVTAKIAELFRPRYILGIDSDRLLIDAASSRLKRLKYQANNNIAVPQNTGCDDEPPKKKPALFFTPRSVTSLSKSVSSFSNSSRNVTSKPSVQTQLPLISQYDLFPSNLSFQQRSIFDMDISVGSRYDTILCLSVSKWIHLYHGDDGLVRFFQIMFDLLKQGGILILEYQPWKSYEKRKNVSQESMDNFATIQILPRLFEDVLVNRIGFTTIERLGPPEEEARGFDRPILILRKCSDPTSASLLTQHTKRR